ncbi:hypothetical protein M427DRAFT_71197 [Gonapodya prolifera JEL478]|uniref:CoA-dependent acyltransferase n=1 Tax=Gonapodya prolifera (strain JEL478) TaxID=1344416 RepID=A0A139AA88_GONPJ|nr:hypothetical protein M427DRAFT_71197 [Gonapodya prolifera JEL478]|eukprot:KXS13599.1 hypothetical protein M427DRAFT_71197 [Gonapodya prolifera JEL478]
METRLILPIIIPDDTRPSGFLYPLVDINLVLKAQVSYLLVFRGVRLDVGRLEQAIAVAAGRVRAACGRLVKWEESGRKEFGIRFTDSPVPFIICIPSSPPPLPNLDVVQEDITAWTPHVDHSTPGEDRAMVELKLTRVGVGESGDGVADVLGVAFHHVVGDAHLMSQFNHLVSLVYTSLPNTPINSLQLPRFTTDLATFRTPTASELAHGPLTHPTAPSTREAAELADRMMHEAGAAESEAVVIRVTPAQLDALQAVVASRCNGVRVSKQDALTAWFVELVRSTGAVVNRVVMMVNFRSFHQLSRTLPHPLTYCLANTFQPIFIPLTAPYSPFSTALSLRTNLTTLRTSEAEMEKWLAYSAYQLRKAVDEDGGGYAGPDERGGDVVVNGNLNTDWLHTFGYEPHAVSFHITWSGVRFLRIFRPNPNSEVPAIETGGAEMVFRVPKAKADGVRSVARRHLEGLWEEWGRDEGFGSA